MTLPPALATLIFIIAVIAGYRYRQTWKSEGSRAALWLWGGIAATGLLVLALVPLAP